MTLLDAARVYLPGALAQLQLPYTIPALTIVYFLSLAAYRLFFHPLKGFPGPRLAAVSFIYECWFNFFLFGEFANHLHVLHDRYGPVVRFGPNKLHFSDPRAYHTIYSTDDFVKDPEFYGPFGILNTAGFMIMDKHAHKARRELLNHQFSKRSILDLQSLVQTKVDKLVAGLRGFCGEDAKPVDIYRAFRSMTADIIMQFCFGTCLNTLDAHNIGYGHPTIIALETAAAEFWWHTYVRPWHFFAFHIAPRFIDYAPKVQGMGQVIKLVVNHIDAILLDRSLLTSQEHPTIYTALLNPKNPATPVPSRQDLIFEGLTLQIAGSDTVGNALMHGTAHLVSTPGVQEALYTELRAAWPDLAAPPPRYEVLETLPYLQAVVRECLRLGVGVPTPIPRIATKPCVIAGAAVPAGTVVAIGTAFLHYSPALFADPTRFEPERWLGARGAANAKWMAAFSRGPRQCQGIHLAYCELTLALASVFRCFECTGLAEGTDLERDLRWKDFFIPHYAGRHVEAWFRERGEGE
ncbi:cytochrome P450 [Geopyxis carbonaria]|nr:cytochrome P450 [Geopyxis carbonaria]